MEKVKTLFLTLIVSLPILLLSGCYRQTTVILPQGQTLPFSNNIASETISSTTAESTPPSSAETTTVQPSHTPKQTTPKESDNTPKETKPASTIPVQSQPHTETTSPIATNPPVETTVPAESTASTETEPPAKPFEHPVYNISSHSIGSYERTMQESCAGLVPLGAGMCT